MFLLLFCCLIVPASLRAADSAEQEVNFWTQRVARDPEDLISPVRLSGAYLRRAREMGDLTGYAKAAELCQRVLEKDPSSYGALLNLGSACIAQHKFSAAKKLAEQALKVNSVKADAYAILFDAQFALGDVDDAEKSLRKLHEKAPDLSSFSRQATLHLLKGESAKAREAFQEAFERGEAHNVSPATLAWVEIQIGAIYFSEGDLKAAEQHYMAALKLAPDYPSTQDRVAELRAAQGDFSAALEIYNRMLLRTPNDAHLFQALGDLYALMQKPAEAKQWHQKALAIYKKSTEQGDVHYLRHLAMYYADTDPTPSEALKYARQDMDVRHDIFAHDALAWALYLNGDFAEAAKEISKALVHETADAHLLYHAGMIFSRSGEFARGQQLIKQAFALNPHFQKFHAHR